MKFRFTLVVWGDWHVGQFVENGLPSLRAAGNFDAVDHVVCVHALAADAERLRAALDGVNFEMQAPIPDPGAFQAVANGMIHACAQRDFAEAAHLGDAWGLLAPDMVWSEGTFALYRRLIEAGNKAVFRPLLRVDSEEAGTVREFGARHLAALALDLEHAMGKLYRPDAEHFTTHTEAIIWPAPDGRLHQTISADVVLCVPSRTPITPQFLCGEPFNGEMAVVGDSDESVALAMTPPDKDYQWQSGAHGRLSPALVRSFLLMYPSPAWRGLAARPYRLHAGDTEPSQWEETERRADEFAKEIPG